MRTLEFGLNGSEKAAHVIAQHLASECTIGQSGGRTTIDDGKIRVFFPEAQKAPQGMENHPTTEVGIAKTCERILTWARREELVVIEEKSTTHEE